MDQYKSVRQRMKENEMITISGGTGARSLTDNLVYKLAYFLGYAGGYGARLYETCYPLVLR